MKDPVINYNAEIDARTKEIIDEYWENEKGKFGITAKELLIKYNFTVKELETIIKSNSSYEVFFPDCIDCKVQSSVIAHLRKNIPYISFGGEYRCKRCQDNFNTETARFKKQQFHDELNIRLEKGIKDKKWLSLNSIELEILKQIIIHKTKSQIFNFIFNKNIYVNDIWKVVNKLSNLDLVIAEREGAFNCRISF